MRFSRVRSVVSGTVAALGLALAGAASALPVNLIANGDFEQGNLLFGSDYAHTPGGNTAAGQYTVASSPQSWNSYLANANDHTPGAGTKLLIGNGASSDSRVWYAQVSVTSGTQYSLEAFVMNVCCNSTYTFAPSPVSPAQLKFYANGEPIASRTPGSTGLWEALTGTWFSGEATSLLLELRNGNLAQNGNDFGVDDIGLYRSTNNVPEPGTLLLTGLGAITLAAHARRRSG